VDFAADHRFAVGTRLHGSVAAIVGGTPAVMVAHDSRTLEVADYHAIPHRTLPSVPVDAGVADLFELADYDAFHAGVAERWSRLTGFLDEAGLAHVGSAGNSEYDERLAAVVPAPAVTTMRAPGEEGIRRIEDRISALQQALAAESRWSRRRIERLLARRTPAPPAPRGLFRRR
jgi:hypothetical protein